LRRLSTLAFWPWVVCFFSNLYWSLLPFPSFSRFAQGKGKPKTEQRGPLPYMASWSPSFCFSPAPSSFPPRQTGLLYESRVIGCPTGKKGPAKAPNSLPCLLLPPSLLCRNRHNSHTTSTRDGFLPTIYSRTNTHDDEPIVTRLLSARLPFSCRALLLLHSAFWNKTRQSENSNSTQPHIPTRHDTHTNAHIGTASHTRVDVHVQRHTHQRLGSPAASFLPRPHM